MVEQRAVRIGRRQVVTGLLLFPAVLLAAHTAFRFLDVDGNRYIAAALALTPYVTLAGLALGVLALVLRRWRIGAGVLALVLALASGLLPRVVANEQPAADGPALRVLTVNLYVGAADAREVTELVRDREVDVLSLQELTPRSAAELEAAGLFSLLPNKVLYPASGASGSGLVSRYPLTEVVLAGPSTMAQPAARAALPGGVDAEFVAVHPLPPVLSYSDWSAELDGLPESRGAARVLAGDFNATLDHAAFRAVVDSGYADAGEQRGEGLSGTWPASSFPPPMTIDHVLVDRRIAVLDYAVLPTSGSDHAAVYAELRIPGVS